MKKVLFLTVLVSALVFGLSASPAAQRFLADDQGLWHFEDNPALIATNAGPGGLLMGVSYDAMDASGSAIPAGAFGDVKAACLIPLLGYNAITFRQNSFDLLTGSALSLGRAFAFGYDLGWAPVQNAFSYKVGLLARPASFVSLGLTGGTELTGSLEGGFGLALRPLAFGGDTGPLSRALSLNVDLSLSPASGFSFDNIGARLLVSEFADLRAWYAPPAGDIGGQLSDGSIGLEVRLSLGQTGITGATPSVTDSSLAWRVGDDIELSLADLKNRGAALPSSSIGRRILVVKDIDAIGMTPAPRRSPLAFLDTRKTMTFPELFALLERARRDKGVQAVAFENLPPIGGAADYEELAAELAALRKAGKKVYLYGDGFGVEYDILASAADEITLNPLGTLGPQGLGLGFHRAYMKPLFDKLGLRFVNLAPWSTKSAYNSFTESSMPPGEEAMMKRFYGDVQSLLASSLAAGRDGKLVGGIDAAFGGGPYLRASEALDAGLVDNLAYAPEFEDSLRAAFPGSTLVSGFGQAPVESWGGPAFKRRAAIVWLSGSIGLGKGQSGRDIGSEAVLELERLRKDRSIAGIILRVDSPGGVVLTSDKIAREVRLAVEAGKPVVVSMGRYAASGGYYVSAPASWIVAEPTTVTGSIGVTGLLPNISDALAKLGIAYSGFNLAPGASFLDPSKDLDQGEIARTEGMILSIYDRFIGVVAAGRNMAPDTVRKLGEGNIYSGREALKLGLVDQLGGLTDAKAWLEVKVGSSLAYEDVLPGENSPLSALSPLSAAIKAALGEGDDRALESLLGPIAMKVQGILAMGQGPLYYLDTEDFGF